MSLQGQSVLPLDSIGALALSDNVFHVVGDTPFLIEKPGDNETMLVLMADKGNFRLRVGNFVSDGMPLTEDPAVEITDGTGGIKLWEGTSLIIPVPNDLTVVGFAADSVLTYFFI